MSLASAYNTLTNYNSNAASAANGVSAAAQSAAATYNANQASNQMAYQTDSMQTAMNYNEAMMQAQMAYNAQEAQKNRDWQEYMTNTSYQRAVKDMIAAGINPILAAQNGGASVGSGSSASTTAATIGMQAGASGQISGYQGQMENTSTTLAMIGAIGSALAEGLSSIGTGLSEMRLFDLDTGGEVSNFFNKVVNGGLLPQNGSKSNWNLGDFGQSIIDVINGRNSGGYKTSNKSGGHSTSQRSSSWYQTSGR